MEENICEKITSLCEARDMRALAGLLEELNPVDIAEALEGLSMRDTALVYRILPKERRRRFLLSWTAKNSRS